MPKFLRNLVLALPLVLAAGLAHAAGTAKTLVPERILGKADAPVTVDEYISLTCPHCAEFYNATLPVLEKKYIDTGKVRFILHDFPLDGVALKAAAVARCMPADEFYPYIKALYKNQSAWAFTADPDKIIIDYAKLGGLDGAKAEACLKDTKLQDAIAAERTEASDKFGVSATPTFIIGKGSKNAQTVQGAQPPEAFEKIFDQLLAEKH